MSVRHFLQLPLLLKLSQNGQCFLEMVEFAYMDAQSESKAEKSAIAIKEFTIKM